MLLRLTLLTLGSRIPFPIIVPSMPSFPRIKSGPANAARLVHWLPPGFSVQKMRTRMVWETMTHLGDVNTNSNFCLSKLRWIFFTFADFSQFSYQLRIHGASFPHPVCSPLSGQVVWILDAHLTRKTWITSFIRNALGRQCTSNQNVNWTLSTFDRFSLVRRRCPTVLAALMLAMSALMQGRSKLDNRGELIFIYIHVHKPIEFKRNWYCRTRIYKYEPPPTPPPNYRACYGPVMSWIPIAMSCSIFVGRESQPLQHGKPLFSSLYKLCSNYFINKLSSLYNLFSSV